MNMPISVIICFTLFLAISSTCEVVLDVLDTCNYTSSTQYIWYACVVTVPDVVGTGSVVTVLDVLGVACVNTGSRLRLTIVRRCCHTLICTYPYFCHLPICVIRCFTLLLAISSTCEVVLDVLDFAGVVTVPDVLGTACVVTVPDVVGTGGEVTVLDCYVLLM